jgi:hypothetical protein
MKTLRILALGLIIPFTYVHAQLPGSESAPLVASDLGLTKSVFHRKNADYGLVVSWKEAGRRSFVHVILGDYPLTVLYGNPIWNRDMFIFELLNMSSESLARFSASGSPNSSHSGTKVVFKSSNQNGAIFEFEVTQELHETLISKYPDLPAAPLASGSFVYMRYE